MNMWFLLRFIWYKVIDMWFLFSSVINSGGREGNKRERERENRCVVRVVVSGGGGRVFNIGYHRQTLGYDRWSARSNHGNSSHHFPQLFFSDYPQILDPVLVASIDKIMKDGNFIIGLGHDKRTVFKISKMELFIKLGKELVTGPAISTFHTSGLVIIAGVDNS